MSGQSGPHRRIPRPLLARLEACEAHAHFLREANRRFENDDPMYYKQVASELRVLFADKRPANRLLLSLLEPLGVDLELNPPRPPSPGWSVHRNGKVEIWKGKIPVETYCEQGVVCVIAGRVFTVGAFVREVAQNEGSSHEAPQLSEVFGEWHSLQLLGLPSHIYALKPLGRTLGGAAEDFMRFVVANRGYRPRYDWSETGT